MSSSGSGSARPWTTRASAVVVRALRSGPHTPFSILQMLKDKGLCSSDAPAGASAALLYVEALCAVLEVGVASCVSRWSCSPHCAKYVLRADTVLL